MALLYTSTEKGILILGEVSIPSQDAGYSTGIKKENVKYSRKKDLTIRILST